MEEQTDKKDVESDTKVKMKKCKRQITDAIRRTLKDRDVGQLTAQELTRLRAHQLRARRLVATKVDPGFATARRELIGPRLSKQDRVLAWHGDSDTLFADCFVCFDEQAVCLATSPFVEHKRLKRIGASCVDCADAIGRERGEKLWRAWRIRESVVFDQIRFRVWCATNGLERLAFCATCGTNQLDCMQANWHVGHDVAASKGGSMDVANLRPICADCNLTMGTTTMEEHTSRCLAVTTTDSKLNCQRRLGDVTVDALLQHVLTFAGHCI